MTLDLAALLVLLTAASGIIWALDAMFLPLAEKPAATANAPSR